MRLHSARLHADGETITDVGGINPRRPQLAQGERVVWIDRVDAAKLTPGSPGLITGTVAYADFRGVRRLVAYDCSPLPPPMSVDAARTFLLVGNDDEKAEALRVLEADAARRRGS